MDINNKMIMDLAEKIGLPKEERGETLDEAQRVANQYKNKSDDELVGEILKLKEVMQKDKAGYAKQIATIKALSGMMQGEQKARLQRILQLLEP